jgi:hypothetical protein
MGGRVFVMVRTKVYGGIPSFSNPTFPRQSHLRHIYTSCGFQGQEGERFKSECDIREDRTL